MRKLIFTEGDYERISALDEKAKAQMNSWSWWVAPHMEKYKRWLFERCPDCNKAKTILGFKTGDHQKCIPF